MKTLPVLGIVLLFACSEETQSTGEVGSEPAALGAPELLIGALEGEDAYLFDGIRSAVWDDAGILISDRGSQSLRAFDRDGVFSFAVGREGQGPGEFQDLRWAERGPDGSIVAFDYRAGRVTWFDSLGSHVRDERIEVAAAAIRPRVLPSLPSGPLFVQYRDVNTPIMMGDLPPVDLKTVDELLGLHHFDGFERLGRFEGTTQMNVSAGGHLILGGPSWMPQRLVASGHGIAATARSTDPFIVRFDASGGIDTIRVEVDSVGFTTEMWDAYWDEIVDPDSPRFAALERQRENSPHPETLPYFAELIVDESGRVWAQEFRLESTEQRWWGFDRSGPPAATFVVADSVEVMDITPTHLVGVVEDELGVERIAVWNRTAGSERPF